MEKTFVGSTSEDRLGVGNLFIGTKVKRTTGGYLMLVDFYNHEEWVECYDIMVLTAEGLRSPEESDLM